MAKRRGLSWEDVFTGRGADDPARDTLKQKIAAAAGYILHGDGERRKTEAAELKRLRETLTKLAEELRESRISEVGEVRALLEFAITKVDAGFARLSGEG